MHFIHQQYVIMLTVSMDANLAAEFVKLLRSIRPTPAQRPLDLGQCNCHGALSIPDRRDVSSSPQPIIINYYSSGTPEMNASNTPAIQLTPVPATYAPQTPAVQASPAPAMTAPITPAVPASSIPTTNTPTDRADQPATSTERDSETGGIKFYPDIGLCTASWRKRHPRD